MKTTIQNGSYEDYITGNTEGKRFRFRLVKANSSPSLINSYGRPQLFPAQLSIPNISTIMERNSAGVMVQEIIRYIPGEASIYKRLQTPDKDVPKKNYKIKIVNGGKIVDNTEPLLLEFMMKCNQNLTNKNRKTDVDPVFELIDSAISVSKEIAKDKIISEATAWCWSETNWDEAKAYARVLNVNLDQSSDEVRHNLKVIAMRDPLKFLNDLKNPAMRKKHYVLEALDRGYLVLDPGSNSIAWSNNQHVPVAVAAIGTSPVDVLVNKLSTDEGALMYNTLLGLLAPEPTIITSMAVPSNAELHAMKESKKVVAEPVPLVTQSDAELMDITEQGIELKLVVFKGPMWYKYKEENFKQKEGFVDGLKKNPSMLKSLLYEIEKTKRTISVQ